VPGQKTSGITVYPIPANDELNIEVNEAFIGKSFQMYSSSGKLVKKGDLDSKINRISIINLPSGIYSIQVPELQEVIRFVKK
jgi:hypothetical protein